MKRKIIKQANQAYTITLPIEWIRSNNLSEKTEVDLEIKEKTITITTNSKSKEEKISLEVENFEIKEIAAIINALYAKGIDEITFKTSKEISSELIKILNPNIGYALTEHKKDTYTIKDIKVQETNE